MENNRFRERKRNGFFLGLMENLLDLFFMENWMKILYNILMRSFHFPFGNQTQNTYIPSNFISLYQNFRKGDRALSFSI